MSKSEKKSSTYSLLKSLDETVQKNKKKELQDSKSSSGLKRKISPKRSSPKRYFSKSSERRKDNYKKPEVVNIETEELDYDIPDRSCGDLYCKACDSHMNSEQMWDSHIRGKRHLKQIKKSEPDHKYDDLNEDPIILPEIKNVKVPIVGLSFCSEYQRLEGKPTYQCHLCSASISTSQLLIEHIIGIKHRMAYMKEYDLDNYNIIMKADLKKGMIEPVVEEYAQKLEDKFSQGKMRVKLEKPKPKEVWYPPPKNQDKKASASAFTNRKRPYEDDQFQNSSGSISDRTRDYPRNFPLNDKFPESPRGDRWSRDPYDRQESTFTRRSLTPPLSSEMGFVRSNNLKSVDTNSPWKNPERQVFDRNQPMTRRAPSPADSILALRGILEDLPHHIFLELMLYVLNRIEPGETEMILLKKIGQRALDLCLKKKLELLPDFHNKAQELSTSSNVSQGSFYKNVQYEPNQSEVPPSIQNLLDSFKYAKSESNASQTISTQPTLKVSSSYEPAYSTQPPPDTYSLWGSNSKDSTAIPGLTLSALQDGPSDRYPRNQPDEPYASTLTWTSNQYNDTFNRY